MRNENKSGHPYKYPKSFILFLLRLKSLFNIDYRTLEGITRKLVVFISYVEKAPDYTTLQIRFTKLVCELEVYIEQGEQEISGGSTGLKTSNRGSIG